MQNRYVFMTLFCRAYRENITVTEKSLPNNGSQGVIVENVYE